MASQATNIIDASTIAKRRWSKQATVESLSRNISPPDLQRLHATLPITLELDEIIGLFHQEANVYMPIEGISYRHRPSGLILQQGITAHHSASYAMSLQEEDLGEVTLYRLLPFGEADLACVEHLLTALLYPLRNGLRYRSALAGALVDPLTGLHNRAALDKAMQREMELAQRTAMPMHVLISDLDFFKQVNDQYGHLAGDCVLRTTAERIRELLRGSDLIFRYGGEEFVVLLPNTDQAGAMMVAERLRATIAASPCLCDGHRLAVTCSIGVSGLNQHDQQQSLFDRADRALYQAKAGGRNQVRYLP